MANRGVSSGRSERARRQSIMKRQKGACKKASELATLCEVELCLICYPPSNMASSSSSPTIWPPDRSKVCDLLHRYRSLLPLKKRPKNQRRFSDDPTTPSSSTHLAAVARGKQSEPPPTVAAESRVMVEALRILAAAIKRCEAAEERERATATGREELLRIPCPDDVPQLLDLADILETRRQAVRAKIAQLQLKPEEDQEESIVSVARAAPCTAEKLWEEGDEADEEQ